MAELNESTMNYAALKRVDPYAKSLLETAAHVALYNFVNNEWDKTDIEGALFVYSRSGEPYHNILIMNRLNMKNLVEPITHGLDLQLQDPFLLYRTSQGSIYGIWFYDKEECVKIASTLTKIIKEGSGSDGKTDRKERMGLEPMAKSVDIFSMLTKAQEEFNSKSPQKNRPDMFGVPLDMNSNFKESGHTPKSVMDFFAKASNGPNFMQDSSIVQQPGLFISSPRSGPPPGLSRMQSVPITIPPPHKDVNVQPFLQRLMSNPAHSVEHIEKQQRAITPVGLIKNGNPILSTSNGSDSMNWPPNLNFNKGLLPINKPGVDSVAPKIQVENSFGFSNVSESSPVTVQSQQFFNSKLVQNCSPLLQDSTLEPQIITNSISDTLRPLSAPVEIHSKPALMPPVMFTASKIQEDYVEASPTTTTALIVNTISGKNSYQPEPLTKNQLLQAVNYLLKHDPDFINKLHEAYVKSFTELVS